MNLPIVNEGTTGYLDATFLTRNGNAEAPSTLVYRIDDVASGATVRGETPIAAGATVTIPLTPSDNAILNPAAVTEKRRVTVKGSYNVDDAVNAQFDYLVRNLSKVP
jgi:hypothetical protein